MPSPFRFVPCGCRGGEGWIWLCVHTESGWDWLVQTQLRRDGFATWVAAESGRFGLRALFPGYVFAQADLSARAWRGIYQMPGVVTVLARPGGQVAEVPPAALALLWDQCGPDGVIHRAAPDAATSGARAELLSGPFAEFAGVVGRKRGERVELLLRIMGREVRATTRTGQVARRD